MIGSDNVQISLASDDNLFVCTSCLEGDLEKSTNDLRSTQVVSRLKEEASDPARGPQSPLAPGISTTTSDVELSNQGSLKVGKKPENFRFKEILDGLSGMKAFYSIRVDL